MDIFEGLKEEFNIDETVEAVKSKMEETENKISEISTNINEQKYNLEDKEYLKVELQGLIASDREVLEVLKEQVIGGAGPNYAMVYATLSKSLRENVAKLIDLETAVTNYQVTESNEDFRERTLQSKEKLAERRLTNNTAHPTQLTQNNNTFILNAKEQFNAMKELKLDPIEVEHPKFDLTEGG